MLVSAALILANLSLASVNGEVRDVFQLPGGEQGQVFVALSEMPPRMTQGAAGDALILSLPGVHMNERRIVPAKGAVFDGLMVAPGDTGSVLRFDGVGQGARAELVAGGILISLGEGRPEITNTIPEERRVVASAMIGSSADAYSSTSGRMHSAASPGSQQATASLSGSSSGPAGRDASGHDDHGVTQGVSLASHDERAAEGSAASGSPTALSPSEPDHVAEAVQEVPGEPDVSVAERVCPEQNMAIEESPWDLDLLTALGECLSAHDHGPDAVEYFEQVLAFEPSHFRAALGLARIREQLGEPDEAARLFEVASRSAITDGEALAARAAARRMRESMPDSQ